MPMSQPCLIISLPSIHTVTLYGEWKTIEDFHNALVSPVLSKRVHHFFHLSDGPINKEEALLPMAVFVSKWLALDFSLSPTKCVYIIIHATFLVISHFN